MRKTLLLELVERDRDLEMVTFAVGTQSHRDIEFKASNGWVLRSRERPSIDTDARVLCVKGSARESDNVEMLVDFDEWSEVLRAVGEYNEENRI